MKTPDAIIKRQYPRTFTLDNGTTCNLRVATATDANRVQEFASALPVDDLLFLRLDLTQARGIKQWALNIDAGRTITLLAETGSDLAGYGTLHHNEVTWQRHLGEIRLLVGSRFRSQGLGRYLAREIFTIAQDLRLLKIVAQMTPEQKGARGTFERMGFQVEALLQDFVIDRNGQTRDLIVMAYDMTGLTAYVN